MPAMLEEPVAHLLKLLESSSSRWIIGMAGLPGSGKSTLAMQLTERVNTQVAAGTMMALGMDGFHLTKAELSRMPNPAEAFARRGALWTFDPAALHARLLRVRNAAGHAAVPWPGFQHDIGDPIEGAEIVLPTVRIILVEGIYLLHNDQAWQPICQFFDERWYFDTPPAVAMERLVQRHMRAWGYTREVAQHRIDTSDRLNAEIVARSRDLADWLLDG